MGQDDEIRPLTVLLAATTVIQALTAVAKESTSGLIAAWLLLAGFAGYVVIKHPRDRN